MSNKILVVEDSLTQAVKIEFFLTDKGYKVFMAASGEEAIEVLESNEIDLVISDVIMPGMDGYELCERIRSNPSYGKVPVILLTSLADPGDIIKGLQSGATNFVTKPYDEGFLYDRIRTVFKSCSIRNPSTQQRVNFEFQGRNHVLEADFEQVFHLLLATYENTLLQSRQLDAAHRKLVNREEQLSSVLASMAAKIAVLDTDMRIITANESWREIFMSGSSEAEVEGVDFIRAVSSSVYLGESLAELREGIFSVIDRRKEKYSFEYSLKDNSGIQTWFLLEVTPMRGKSGGAVASFIEITERKQMERDIIEARDAAEQANRMKSRFLASMSHEIRTPLNAVVGLTDLTLRSQLEQEQRDNLETVRLSADQLLTLINDILDLSKVEARMLKLEKSDFSLSESLYAVVRSMEQQARGKGLVLNLDIDADVPEVVNGDEGRLKQIVYNLVGNSIKFTEQGGVFVQVSQLDNSGHCGQNVLQVAVRDTGIGIPEEKQSVIFDSFRQADDSTTRKFGGSGLGLAISRELVEMMGGAISVRSAEGYGSVFTFTVILQPGDPSKVIPEVKVKALGPPEVGDLYRILLVEDNPINVKVARRLFEKMGHQVAVAGNGVEALSSLARMDIDLVFMDIEMPKMDGFEAAKNIRMGMAGDDKKNVPIIAMSAHAMSGIRQKCLKSGMNDYIAKPVQYKELNYLIANFMKDGRGDSTTEGRASTPLPVLDRTRAEEMYHGDSVLYSELCSMFFEDLEGDIAKFVDSVDGGDMDTARRIAHTLKSSCAAICAPMARAAATSLEKAVLNSDREQVLECLNDFLQQAGMVKSMLTD